MVQNPVASQSEDVTVSVGGDASGATGALDNVIGKLDDVKLAVGAAGGVIAGLGVKLGKDAVDAAASFEDAIIDLQKVAGEGVAGDMESRIQEMAEEIPLTAEELASLSTEAARFGVEGTENIESFVESAAKMSTATTLSVDESSEAFAKLSELTNTPIEDVENLGSAINTLSNNYATNSQEIVDASMRSAGALSDLGLQETEIFGLSAAVNEVSESSDRAGTRLRRLSQEMMDADAEEFAEPLGMAPDEFERMREEDPRQMLETMAETMAEGGDAADELRGQLSTTSRQAMSGLSQNIEGVREAQKTSNEAFEDGTSIQSEFDQETEKTTTQQELLSSKIQNVKRDLGEDLLPAFNSTIDVVADAVDSFSGMNDETDGMLAKWGLVGSTLAGAAAAIAFFVGGPVTLLIGGVAALAAAVATNFAGIRDAIEAGVETYAEAFDFILEIFDDFADAFGSDTDELVDGTLSRVYELAEQFTDFVQSINDRAQDILDDLRQYWRANGEDIVDSVVETYETIRERVESAIAFVRDDVLGPFVDAAESLWNDHGGELRNEIRETWEVIRRRIESAIDFVRPYIIDGLEAIQQFWDDHGDRIMGIVERAFETIAWVVETYVDTVITVARAGLAVVRGDFDDAWDLISGLVEDAMEFVADTVQSGVQAVVDYVAGIGRDEIKDAFESVGSAIRTVILGVFGVGGTLLTIIGDFVGEVVNYIGRGEARNDIEYAFDLLTDAITSVIRGAFSVGGTLLTIIGDFVAELVHYIGSGEALNDIVGAFETLVDSVFAVFEGLYDGLIGNSLIPDMMGDIRDELLSWSDWIGDSFADIVGNAFGTVASEIGDALSGISIDWPSPPDWLSDALSEVSGGIEDAVSWVEDQAPSGGGGGSSGSGGSSGGGGGDGGGGGGSTRPPSDGVGDPRPGVGMATGGFVAGDGMAMLHANERVLPESQVTERGEASFDPQSVADGFDDASATTEMLRELQQLRRSIDQLGSSHSGQQVTEKDIVRALGVAIDRQGGRDPLD